MLVYIGSTHITNFAFELMYLTLRFWDRKCSCDTKKTRKLIQEDYEDLNTGNRFEIESRYASLLFVLGVTFLYSSGMPILYPIAAAFFFVGYWIDKMLLLKFYRKPIHYDGHLSKKTLGWHKFILLMHVLGGTLMYANSSIVPSRSVWLKKISSFVNTNTDSGW